MKKNYILSFVIPLSVVIFCLIINRISPFGNNSLMIIDASAQYIDFLAYFKTIFSEGNNLFYTFSKTLGGNMVDLSAYYLLSPFNFLVLFFSNSNLDLAFMLIVILKLATCGLTFYYYAVKNGYNKYSSLIFSTTYALIGYNVAYFWNIMWLDGVILLPLVALGIDKIIVKKSAYLYITALAIAIITNYYIGYMICIFSFIYFIYKYILKNINIKTNIITIKNYILSSLAGVGISCFWLVPTVLSLEGGKAGLNLSELTFTRNFYLTDFISKIFTNNITYDQLKFGLPNIFVGMLIIFLVILYFINKNIKIKEKIMSITILIGLFICMYIDIFNKIFHAFNRPEGFPYRYSFIFSFFLIIIAMKGFQHLKNIKNKKYLLMPLLIMIIPCGYHININNFEYIKQSTLFYDLLIIIISFILIFFFLKTNKQILVFILAVIQVFNLTVNTYFSFKTLKVEDEYNLIIDDTEEIVKKITKEDDSFYRMEKTYERSLNDPMQFNYKGLSHFSSTEKENITIFGEDMGLRNHRNIWAAYISGPTTSAESFLGVKYVIDNNIFLKEYDKKFLYKDYSIYENPYVLPIAFPASEEILNGYNINSDNFFETQNEIWNKINPEIEENIFINVDDIKTTYSNLDVVKESDYTKYTKINKDEEAYINFTVSNDNYEMLYAFITAPERQDVDILLNNQKIGKYFDTYEWSNITLGNIKESEKTIFSIKLNQDSIKISDVIFYEERLSVLEDYVNEINHNEVIIKENSSSNLRIEVTSDKEYLLMTIPYDEGWYVKNNNKEVKIEKAFDNLLAIKLDKGTNIIEINYVPKGFYIGLIISLLTLILLLIVKIIKVKNTKK